jgi:hypothetical protein
MSSLHDSIPEQYRYDEQIIRETTEQIVRDFNNDQLKLVFSGNPRLAFTELKNQLMPFIKDLMKSPAAFQGFLYRVDVSESEYIKTLNASSPESLEAGIAEMIIRREFRKVLTRKYFSGK